jgi:hypothetical protein
MSGNSATSAVAVSDPGSKMVTTRIAASSSQVCRSFFIRKEQGGVRLQRTINFALGNRFAPPPMAGEALLLAMKDRACSVRPANARNCVAYFREFRRPDGSDTPSIHKTFHPHEHMILSGRLLKNSITRNDVFVFLGVALKIIRI